MNTIILTSIVSATIFFCIAVIYLIITLIDLRKLINESRTSLNNINQKLDKINFDNLANVSNTISTISFISQTVTHIIETLMNVTSIFKNKKKEECCKDDK
jgi:hypothetical protein